MIDGPTCTLRMSSGSAAREHDVEVTGEGVRVCARLRRGALVGVEGRAVDGGRVVAVRVRAIRSRP